jgi:putative membrane protein
LTFLGCWAPLAHQESSQSTKNAASDEQFAKKAAQGGMAEVKMGELAEQKGTSEAVKKFGQRMAQDHTKADEELRRAAMKENISLPTDLDTKDQATYDALAKLSGSSFDRAYARDMVKDHEQDIAEFKREANSGKNESIKNFAPQTLPTLEDHLKEAREVRPQNPTAQRELLNSGNHSVFFHDSQGVTERPGFLGCVTEMTTS